MEQMKLFPGDCMPEGVSLLDLVSRYVKTYGAESIELLPFSWSPDYGDWLPFRYDFKLPRNFNQD